ncbi:MAG: DUF512 domain-containing protein [Ruminococcaceae bacterium]|nr:DUF512 domain-containing protein [Oscillospiraceae bacterium]
MVKICDVNNHSYSSRHGILPGDILISVNGNEINDVLDYRFYLTDRKLDLLLSRNGTEYSVSIKKNEYDDIGLEFETYLMDSKKSCKNKCVFCFIDQLPKGLRDTLYFKDDDARLSFLMGNYVTLTGLKDSDVDRIIKMHMSPINVSVHTTNPDLRCKMMNNRFAGKSLDYLKRFAKNNITLNCQIVLCKGLNDGDELLNTMHDLASLYPSVNSVSIVPAGLTKYRDNLYPLEPFSPDESKKIIQKVQNFALLCKKEYGSSIFFCGDEMYLKAGMEIPSPDYYEDFSQIENGVGMIASMLDEFDYAFDELDEFPSLPRKVSVATGNAAYKFICSLTERLEERFKGLEIKVYNIDNDFFGHNITVAGLVTGIDLINQLKDKSLGSTLYIPRTMLESEGKLFLDSMSIDEVSAKLNVKIETITNDGENFMRSLLGL